MSGGRPSLATPELKALIVKRLRKGMTRIQAAASVGIGHTSLWKWQKDDPEFADAIAKACALFGRELVDAMVEMSRDKVHTKRMEATKFLLESRFPDESPRVNQLVADAVDEYDRRLMARLRELPADTQEQVAHALTETRQDIRDGRPAPAKPTAGTQSTERPSSPSH